MKLIYCYVEEFRNIVQEGFNFSCDYVCSFNKKTLTIEKRVIPIGENLLLDDYTKNLTVIVGKTGSGKTNLLQLLGMPEEARQTIAESCKYFILYSVDPENNRYAIEVNRIIPKGLAHGKRIPAPGLLYFTYCNNKITKVHIKDSSDKCDTVFIHSFELGSVRKGYFDGLHIDGVYNESNINPRLLIPYDKVNAEVACWYAKEYISQFNDDNLKRDAELEIRSINWNETLRNDISESLLNKEYWFYHDYLPDKNWKNVRDVPKFFNRNVQQTNRSFKEQFIHDLLTDFALYLRKWADLIKPITSEQLQVRQAMGLIKDLEIPGCHTLPDERCDNLRKRISWLCQYIDLHTDEKYGNQGLVWQIGTDIIDIADSFEQFDNSFFTDGKFLYPIEDMDFENPALKNLFERMSGYRADQLGIFTGELLPFDITYLSSGEYQYAKILGIVTEFSSTIKVRAANQTPPENIILMLDEPETYMHPEMCRNFLYWMRRVLLNPKQPRNVQVIMTTHSPFMLSDVLPSQILRISFDDNGYCQVLPQGSHMTFANDIYSIMVNEFFLDYTIGELSRRKIASLINLLNVKCNKDENLHVADDKEEATGMDSQELNKILKPVLSYIGDPIIRESLTLMLNNYYK